jgi:hypothetical protein
MVLEHGLDLAEVNPVAADPDPPFSPAVEFQWPVWSPQSKISCAVCAT